MIKKTFLNQIAAIFELGTNANLKWKIIDVNILAITEYIYIKVFHNVVRFDKMFRGWGSMERP